MNLIFDLNLIFCNFEIRSYGKQLEAMVAKVIRMGFDGIYHDDFMARLALCGALSYTPLAEV